MSAAVHPGRSPFPSGAELIGDVWKEEWYAAHCYKIPAIAALNAILVQVGSCPAGSAFDDPGASLAQLKQYHEQLGDVAASAESGQKQVVFFLQSVQATAQGLQRQAGKRIAAAERSLSSKKKKWFWAVGGAPDGDVAGITLEASDEMIPDGAADHLANPNEGPDGLSKESSKDDGAMGSDKTNSGTPAPNSSLELKPSTNKSGVDRAKSRSFSLASLATTLSPPKRTKNSVVGRSMGAGGTPKQHSFSGWSRPKTETHALRGPQKKDLGVSPMDFAKILDNLEEDSSQGEKGLVNLGGASGAPLGPQKKDLGVSPMDFSKILDNLEEDGAQGEKGLVSLGAAAGTPPGEVGSLKHTAPGVAGAVEALEHKEEGKERLGRVILEGETPLSRLTTGPRSEEQPAPDGTGVSHGSSGQGRRTGASDEPRLGASLDGDSRTGDVCRSSQCGTHNGLDQPAYPEVCQPTQPAHAGEDNAKPANNLERDGDDRQLGGFGSELERVGLVHPGGALGAKLPELQVVEQITTENTEAASQANGGPGIGEQQPHGSDGKASDRSEELLRQQGQELTSPLASSVAPKERMPSKEQAVEQAAVMEEGQQGLHIRNPSLNGSNRSASSSIINDSIDEESPYAGPSPSLSSMRAFLSRARSAREYPSSTSSSVLSSSPLSHPSMQHEGHASPGGRAPGLPSYASMTRSLSRRIPGRTSGVSGSPQGAALSSKSMESSPPGAHKAFGKSRTMQHRTGSARGGPTGSSPLEGGRPQRDRRSGHERLLEIMASVQYSWAGHGQWGPGAGSCGSSANSTPAAARTPSSGSMGRLRSFRKGSASQLQQLSPADNGGGRRHQLSCSSMPRQTFGDLSLGAGSPSPTANVCPSAEGGFWGPSVGQVKEGSTSERLPPRGKQPLHSPAKKKQEEMLLELLKAAPPIKWSHVASKDAPGQDT